MNDDSAQPTPSATPTASVSSEKLLGDGFRLDLSKRPSLADLGLEAGKTQAVHELPDMAPFDASVTFAEGSTLETKAQNLTSSAVADTPRTFTLGTPTLDLDGTREAIKAAPGIDAADRDQLTSFAAASAKSGEFGRRVADAEVGAPDSMQVEVVVDRPNEFHVNYIVILGQ